jgi:hypothetical protein
VSISRASRNFVAHDSQIGFSVRRGPVEDEEDLFGFATREEVDELLPPAMTSPSTVSSAIT